MYDKGGGTMPSPFLRLNAETCWAWPFTIVSQVSLKMELT